MKPAVLSDPVSAHMRKDFVVLDEETTVTEAVRRMKEKGVTSVLISSKDGKITGIVTERDVLYRVVAEGKDPKSVRLREIKSSPLVTVTPQTKVSDAIALMSQKGIRRVVVAEGCLLYTSPSPRDS